MKKLGLGADQMLSRSQMKKIMAGEDDAGFAGESKNCGKCNYGATACTEYGTGPLSGCSCPTSSGGANTTCS